LRQVARDASVSLSTVQLWVGRPQHRRLDEVDWADRSSRPRRTSRTPRPLEDLVLQVRQELRDTSDLGEFGAAVIRADLLARDVVGVPSVRTVGRILERRGVLDARRRVRRPPPPRGWYLPAVAHGDAELESVDIIEGLYIRGGPHVEVINLLSFHGGVSPRGRPRGSRRRPWWMPSWSTGARSASPRTSNSTTTPSSKARIITGTRSAA